MIDSREKDFIPTDKEKRTRIDAAGTKKDHKGMDAVVVFDHTWGDVEESGLGNLYNNRMVKILTEKGIAQYSVLRFDYDPKSYINNVLQLRIHRCSGDVEELDVNSYRDVMQPERLLYWRVKMKLYSLPHLEVGDAIEWETFKKGFNVAYLQASPSDSGAGGGADFDRNSWVDPETGIKPPMYGAFYDIVYFQETIPIKEKRYTLLSPRKMPLSFEFYHGNCRSWCLVNDDYYTYSWEKQEVEALKPEPRMPGQQSTRPKLLVSTIHDWREKSRWFHDANIHQFEWDDSIQKVVDELTAPFETDEEKAAALLHWVSQEIRYIGFSVSQGEGYTLHSGPMTFHERGGVCKDYAGMLVTMLRAAGLESYAAQTQALEPVDRIPADQFDHCVTAWRKKDGSWVMLDPTWAPYSMDIWDAAETGQNYLIGSPEGELVGRIRDFKPEDSKVELSGSSQLAADGSLTGEVEYQGSGRFDSSQRFMRAWQPARNRARNYRKILSTIDPAVEIGKIETTDIDDLYNNFVNRIEYQIPGYAMTHGEDILVRIPIARMMMSPSMVPYLSAADTPERKQKLRVIYRQLAEVEEEIRIPEGYRLASKPVSVRIEKETADFEATVTECEGKLMFRARFILKPRIITPEQYKDFKAVVDKVQETADRWFTLRKSTAGNCQE